MNYNRNKINNLDPRQCVYIKHHEAEAGTEQIVINGKTYMDRCEENRPTEKEIEAALFGFEDREAYLWCNMRGWCLVFRTDANEDMFAWDAMEKVN